MRRRLSTDYERISDKAIDGSYPRFCRKCKRVKCRRHGGEAKPFRPQDGTVQSETRFEEPRSQRAVYLHEMVTKRRHQTWADDKGHRFGYVGDPVIAL